MTDEKQHPVAWTKGGEAFVVRLDGDAITLRSSVPSPPGSRIEGTLAARGDPDATWSGEDRAGARGAEPLRVKIHSSKLQADGTFVLEGRVLDLTRSLRARLTE